MILDRAGLKLARTWCDHRRRSVVGSRPRRDSEVRVPRGDPVILAACGLKLPTLAGPARAHICGQVIVGYLVCGVAACVSVRFLVKYFETRTPTPSNIFCLVVGAASVIRFA